jgi:NDP-sugar pyrophosphorylase family protein
MVEVLGRPVIDFVKDAMVDAGVEHLVVTTGYRGEQLSDHVEQWSTHSGINARINQEAVPMGTAGSVRLLLDELTETFVVGSGDAVASFDIQALIEAHRAHGAKVTMALWEVEDPTEFGIVGLSETHQGALDGELRQGFIRQFKEKPTLEEAFSNVINAGLYILEPEVLALVPEGEKFDFSKQLFPMVLDMGWPMYAQTINGVWFDVGHPMDTLPFPVPNGLFTSNGSYWTAGTSRTSSLQNTIKGSVISNGVVVSDGAIITDSLLMSGCSVAKDAIITDSILGRNVVIGEGAVVRQAVLGDGVVIEANGSAVEVRIPNNA